MIRTFLACLLLLPVVCVPANAAERAVTERVVELPETGSGWHLSIFVSPDWQNDPEQRQVVGWFASEPRLARLKTQTHSHLYTTDDPLYQARFAQSVPRVPAIMLQNATGKVYYKVGATINVPGSGAEVADGIAYQLASASGEVGRLFRWLRPRPRPFCRPDDEDCGPKPDEEDEDGGPPPPNPPDLPVIPDIGPPDVSPDIPPLPDIEHNHDAINAKLDELAAAIAAIPAGPQGPAGEPGPPGPPGPAGADADPGQLAAQITAEIKATILQQMAEQFGALDVRIEALSKRIEELEGKPTVGYYQILPRGK